jgi:hypothetical protein
MPMLGKIIADMDQHVRASIDRVLKAREGFEQVTDVIKRSETAYLQSKATLSRLNGHSGSGRT